MSFVASRVRKTPSPMIRDAGRMHVPHVTSRVMHVTHVTSRVMHCLISNELFE